MAMHCPLDFQSFMTQSIPHEHRPCVLVHLCPFARAVTQTALSHPLSLWVLLPRSSFSALSWVVSSRVLHPPYQTLSSPLAILLEMLYCPSMAHCIKPILYRPVLELLVILMVICSGSATMVALKPKSSQGLSVIIGLWRPEG